MNGGLELKPKSLDELFRQYMANSGTQEQSQISPMDYLNMDDGQNKSDMANDNPLQKTDSFVNLLKGDQTVQPEQKKQGGNIIEDFLGGLGKAVGGIAKVGAAVVAPTAVNAFYDQRQKMANKALADEATKFIVANQGNDFTTNDIFVHLRATNPDAFKHADISQVNRDVANAFQPVLTVDASKIQNKKQFDDLFFDAWSEDKPSIKIGEKIVDIGIGSNGFKDELNKMGLNFEINDYDQKGNVLYKLSNQEQLTPEKWDAIFNLAKKYKIPPEQVRRKFDLQNRPSLREEDLSLRKRKLENDEKWKNFLMGKKGRGASVGERLSAYRLALETQKLDESGELAKVPLQDLADSFMFGNAPDLSLLTNSERSQIEADRKAAAKGYDDADALVKPYKMSASSFIDAEGNLSFPNDEFNSAIADDDVEKQTAIREAWLKVSDANKKLRGVSIIKKQKAVPKGEKSAVGAKKYEETVEGADGQKYGRMGQRWFNIKTGQEVKKQ